LRDLVYERIKSGIKAGKFAANERLVEESLASELGVSRTPVREAISRLEHEGLVVKVPQKGAIVRRTTKEEIEEIFGLRAVLESYAASLATKKMSDAVMTRLHGMIDKSERALANGNIREYIQLNTKFHDLLYRASESAKLYQMINLLRDALYEYRVMLLEMENMPQMSLRDHKDMFEAMLRKDAQEVERLVREHILRGKETVLRHVAHEAADDGRDRG